MNCFSRAGDDRAPTKATFDVVSAARAFSATIGARARNDALFMLLDVLFD